MAGKYTNKETATGMSQKEWVDHFVVNALDRKEFENVLSVSTVRIVTHDGKFADVPVETAGLCFTALTDQIEEGKKTTATVIATPQKYVLLLDGMYAWANAKPHTLVKSKDIILPLGAPKGPNAEVVLSEFGAKWIDKNQGCVAHNDKHVANAYLSALQSLVFQMSADDLSADKYNELFEYFWFVSKLANHYFTTHPKAFGIIEALFLDDNACDMIQRSLALQFYLASPLVADPPTEHEVKDRRINILETAIRRNVKKTKGKSWLIDRPVGIYGCMFLVPELARMLQRSDDLKTMEHVKSRIAQEYANAFTEAILEGVTNKQDPSQINGAITRYLLNHIKVPVNLNTANNFYLYAKGSSAPVRYEDIGLLPRIKAPFTLGYIGITHRQQPIKPPRIRTLLRSAPPWLTATQKALEFICPKCDPCDPMGGILTDAQKKDLLQLPPQERLKNLADLCSSAANTAASSASSASAANTAASSASSASSASAAMEVDQKQEQTVEVVCEPGDPAHWCGVAVPNGIYRVKAVPCGGADAATGNMSGKNAVANLRFTAGKEIFPKMIEGKSTAGQHFKQTGFGYGPWKYEDGTSLDVKDPFILTVENTKITIKHFDPNKATPSVFFSMKKLHDEPALLGFVYYVLRFELLDKEPSNPPPKQSPLAAAMHKLNIHTSSSNQK